MDTSLRCPACGALVVDRRSSSCTTCHADLPQDWVLSPEQIQRIETIDQHARAEHAVTMSDLDNRIDTDATTPIDDEEIL
jgi:hypothetical protein